jgi:5'-nucleotidase
MNKENEMNGENRTVYVDMDGVIADFDAYYEHLFGINPKHAKDKIPDGDLWKNINDYGRVRFFSELPWITGSEEMWKFISDNFLHVKILTALGKSDFDGKNRLGKRTWLQNHIPSLMDNDIIMVANKHKKRHYSRSGDIIIDDRDIVVDEWAHKGGIGILFKSAPETIERLRQYI